MNHFTDNNDLFFYSGICATAAYFGDETFTVRQLYKIVDQVFDTMTIVTEATETLEHWMVAQKIGEHQLVVGLLCNPKCTKRSKEERGEEEDGDDDDDEKSILNAQYAPNYHHHTTSGNNRRRSNHATSHTSSKVDNKPFVMTRLENCSMTDVSSVMLSPLIQIPVGRDSVSNF